MIYNIKNQNSTKNLKAAWDTKNSRSDIVVSLTPKPKTNPSCTNFFNTNNDVCDIRNIADLFLSHSIIKSSNPESFRNNNNTKINNDSKIIRITKTSSAIRANFFNIYTGKFDLNLQNFAYNLLKQNVNTVFMVGKFQYVNGVKFLTDSYKLSEQPIIDLNNFNLNLELSSQLNQNVYSIQCENFVDCDNCCFGIAGNFFRPPSDLDNIYNSETLGIIWKNFDFVTSQEEESSILNVYKNNILIISIFYSHYYNNKEITLKHPMINSLALVLNSSISDIFL